MNTSNALFTGFSRAAGRTIVTGTLRPGRALAIGLRRPFSTIVGVLPGLSNSRCRVSSNKCTNSPCLCVVLYDSRQLSGTTFSHLQLSQGPATAGPADMFDRDLHESFGVISGSANTAGRSSPVCTNTAH